MADITQNPDYRLVMTFLKNINPGDMDQESAEQLMMIGERMKAGGALSDREREMFESVVSNMPMDPNMGAVSDSEMQMYTDNLPRPTDPNMGAVSDSEMQMYNQRMPSQDGMSYSPSSGVTSAMPSQDGKTYSQSSGVTPANNVMTLEEAVAAGIVAPTARPQARPAPMRPQARPMR